MESSQEKGSEAVGAEVSTTATTRYHRDFLSHNYNAGTLVTVLAVRTHAGMEVATVRFPNGETTTMRTNELTR